MEKAKIISFEPSSPIQPGTLHSLYGQALLLRSIKDACESTFTEMYIFCPDFSSLNWSSSDNFIQQNMDCGKCQIDQSVRSDALTVYRVFLVSQLMRMSFKYLQTSRLHIKSLFSRKFVRSLSICIEIETQ